MQQNGRRWPLLNQVTRESEAEQKHESSMLLKLTYVDRNFWQFQSQEIPQCQVENLLAINTSSVTGVVRTSQKSGAEAMYLARRQLSDKTVKK